MFHVPIFRNSVATASLLYSVSSLYPLHALYIIMLLRYSYSHHFVIISYFTSCRLILFLGSKC